MKKLNRKKKKESKVKKCTIIDITLKRSRALLSTGFIPSKVKEIHKLFALKKQKNKKK